MNLIKFFKFVKKDSDSKCAFLFNIVTRSSFFLKFWKKVAVLQ